MDKHILIVEDEPMLALDLESLVRDVVEADFIVCRRASEALRWVADRDFDFALLDVDVVDGTTFDVARALARRGERFVFVSASDRRDDAAACGALAYVAKPYKPEDIRAAVTQGLKAA